MRVLLLLLILLFFSCKQEIPVPLNITTENPVSAAQLPAQTIKSKQYGFVKVITAEPVLLYVPEYYLMSKDAFTPAEKRDEMVDFDIKPLGYFSKIIEFEDYNEDEKYKATDAFVSNVEEQMSRQFQVDVMNKVKNSETRERLLKITGKIIEKDFLIFNSYAEASKALDSLKTTN